MLHRAHTHIIAIVFSIAVGMIYGMPHIILFSAAQEQGLRYHPVVVNEDEALFTGPKAHAAEMGEIIVGDFNVAEYKDTRLYVLPFLSPLIMGNLARLTGSIERAFIAGDFLFPPIIFLLFYTFLLILLNLETGFPSILGNPVSKLRRLLSLFGATLFIFIPQLLLAFPPLTRYLQATILTLAAKGSSLYFSRVEDPQLTLPLYLATLIFFLLIFKGRKEKRIIAAAGIAYGLLFYSYFYFWTYTTVGMALGITLTWRRMRAVSLRLIAATALGLLISIPHWINAYGILRLPQYPDLFARHGPEIGRTLALQSLPVFAYFLHAALAGALWFLFRKTQRGIVLFFISFLMPIYAVYNMQIATGFNVQPDHWFKPALPIVNAALLTALFAAGKRYADRITVRMLAIPWIFTAAFLLFKIMRTEATLVRQVSLALLVISTLIFLWIGMARRYAWLREKRVFSVLAALAIALLFVKAIAVQQTFVARNAPKTIPPEEFASYQWLTRHTPAYSVIATPSFTTNARLQLYTQNRLFLPNGYNTLAGNQELWLRLRLTNTLFGASAGTYHSYLKDGSALGGGGADNEAVNNLYFSFEPKLDTLAAYYLFTFTYLNRAPGDSFKGETPLFLPASVIARETQEYEKQLLADATDIPYQLDYLYYGPRERHLVPYASALASFEKIYDRDEIVIYRYRKDAPRAR